MNSFPDIVNISDGQDSFSFPKWTQTPGLTHQQYSLYKQTISYIFKECILSTQLGKQTSSNTFTRAWQTLLQAESFFPQNLLKPSNTRGKNISFSPMPGNNLVLTVAHRWLPACCYMIYAVLLICDPICTMQMSSDSSLFLSLKQTMAPVTKKEISNRRKLFSLFLCLYFFFFWFWD